MAEPKLAEHLGTTLVSLLVTSLAAFLVKPLLTEPWQAIIVIGPLIVVAVLVWKWVYRQEGFHLGGKHAIALGAYTLIFAIAISARFLDWNSSVAVPGVSVERSFLVPSFLGDWRYWLIPAPRIPDDTVVVTLAKQYAKASDGSQGFQLERLRLDMRRLISFATSHGARGVALDFHLDKPSHVDSQLCATVTSARGRNVSVFATFGFHNVNGRLIRNSPRIVESLKCLAGDAGEFLGHPGVLVDSDRRTRSLPLEYSDWGPALSLRVARVLAGDDLTLPEDGSVKFVSGRYTTVSLSELESSPNLQRLVTDAFLLVGDEADTLLAPGGNRLGAAIHADAVHSIVSRRWIRVFPWWASYFGLVACCYWLQLLHARKRPVREMLSFSFIATALWVIVAAALIRFQLIWLDVVYPIFAVWLFLLLLQAPSGVIGPIRARVARVRGGQTSDSAPPPKAPVHVDDDLLD